MRYKKGLLKDIKGVSFKFKLNTKVIFNIYIPSVVRGIVVNGYFIINT